MSMELHVFFRGKLPTKAALTKAMKELGFPLSISPAAGSLEQQSGFMPMRWRREEAGVEFDVWSGRATLEEIKSDGVDPRFDRSANFRWGGEESELLCALCAAAALAKLVDGVVFDPEENELQSIDEAIASARATLQDLTKHEAKKASGTTTTDLRRYLKPLLKLRPDLKLVGRLLITRPVRHVVRGALFEGRHGNFYVSPYLGPVYGGSAQDFGHVRGTWEVWQPHYEALLIDSLREDIFDDVSQVMSLSDYADRLAARERRTMVMVYDQNARVLAHLLGGNRDAATAYVDETERASTASRNEWVEKQRVLLARDIADVCEEYRGKEAAVAQAHKLGDAWEPSPFPVEIPKAERARRSSEPHFATTPWVDTPEELIATAPDRPGEIAFGTNYLQRKGRFVIQVPLTREQAETMHRNKEEYCLLARLPGGELLVVERNTGWSPSNPRLRPGYTPSESYRLRIYTREESLHAEFSESFDEPGILEFYSLEISRDGRHRLSLWYDRHEKRKTLRPEGGYLTAAMTDAELALYRRPLPAFGEYKGLLGQINGSLEINGYPPFV